MHTNLTEGTRVFTSDGDELGTVKEVRGNYFKVNASMQPDYWLSCDVVTAGTAATGTTTGTDHHARVSFTKDMLGDYKRSEPAAA
jgi:hypothetical protein